jgi:1-acyl-sn-glycerol-3-phosphate acyltransferase
MAKKNKRKISRFRRFFSQLLLNIHGWRLTGTPPKEKKYVIVGYPHTSNWDVYYGLLVCNAFGVKPNWIAKQQLFKGPLKYLFHQLGAIPVNRKSPKGFVEQIVDKLNQSTQMVITISPEGTRDKTDYWKSGFYRLAKQANVPAVVVYLDYANKKAGFSEPITMSDNIVYDVEKMKRFLAGKTGKFPHKMGVIAVKELKT